jgi:2-hydroxychromene-2-carboxylate isomerase
MDRAVVPEHAREVTSSLHAPGTPPHERSNEQLIELWYELASPYSYLSAMRAEPLVAAAGRRLVWRVFLLGPIFEAQLGSSDSPFNRNPVRGRYMWRDVERQCAKYGLPFRRPSRFPRASVLAARIALLGEDEPWGSAFARAVLAANFAEDRDISRPEVVREIAQELGLPVEALVARAGEEVTKQRLRARTAEAAARDIFGAPTFFVDGEMFWGDDRLEDALAWRGGV